MLVKLGDIWVDPSKVESVACEKKEGNVCIVTERHSYLSIPENIDSALDEFAAIINNALNTQSFGGEIEEKPKE